jgi:hypothetical protein
MQFCVSVLFESEEVLLLDPAEAITTEGVKYAQGKQMLIFAASNNESHFGNGIFKANAKALPYLSPCWSEEELTTGLPKMKQDINLELALKRAKDDGMLPCYLLDEKAYNGRNELLNAALKKLSENPITKLKDALCYVREYIFLTILAIPGTLITVYSGVQEPDDKNINEIYFFTAMPDQSSALRLVANLTTLTVVVLAGHRIFV